LANIESLHNHTTASDGPVDQLELLRLGEQFGYSVMALTDHDVVPSAADLEKLRSYTGRVKWLSGIEISSGLPTELGGGVVSMFHIIGLFVDPTNQALVDHCRQAQEARLERTQRIVANLRSIGFQISVEDVLADAGGEAVGRRNIARALARTERYALVMERLKHQMADEAKEDPEVAMQYMRMLEHPENDHPFWLFLSEDSYLDDIYVDYLYSVDMDTSVKLIRDAGGVAMLAHWPTVERQISLELLEDLLKTKRLDGIELRSAFEDDEQDMIEAKLREMAERTGAAMTYGTDAHTERDIENFARRPVGQRTIGQTQTLLDRYKPSLEFTNFS
jgi:predicted metal-dependent phosphoesterase TrpH